MTPEQKEICRQALVQFGIEHQILKAIEECGELIQALSRWSQYRYSQTQSVKKYPEIIGNVAEELADVKIVIQQIQLFASFNTVVEDLTTVKIKRLETLISSEDQ